MAYERTKARLKMPPGRRETSFRSSASSAAIEILVALAIWRSETPRRSRASRSLAPKPPDDESAAMGGRGNRAYVRDPSAPCQTLSARGAQRYPAESVRG